MSIANYRKRVNRLNRTVSVCEKQIAVESERVAQLDGAGFSGAGKWLWIVLRGGRDAERNRALGRLHSAERRLEALRDNLRKANREIAEECLRGYDKSKIVRSVFQAQARAEALRITDHLGKPDMSPIKVVQRM